MKNRHKITIGALLGALLLKWKLALLAVFVFIEAIENVFFVWLGAEKGISMQTVVIAFLTGYIMFYIVNEYEKLVGKAKKLKRRF